jgi:hypothetical protein
MRITESQLRRIVSRMVNEQAGRSALSPAEVDAINSATDKYDLYTNDMLMNKLVRMLKADYRSGDRSASRTRNALIQAGVDEMQADSAVEAAEYAGGLG